MQRTLLALAMLAAPALALYEWSGAFDVSGDTSHTWSAQAVNCEYADPSMKIVMMISSTLTSAELTAQASALEAVMDGTCTAVNSGETMTPTAAGVCYTLTFSTTEDSDTGFTDSTFTIDTTGVDGIIFAGQHVPTEFERDTHYLYDSAGTDVEPSAEDGGPTRYAYFDCSADGATISYGEECTTDQCTPATCVVGGVGVTSPTCYIAGGFVHWATCASDGATVTVEISEDNSATCDTDYATLTFDQTHTESPGCAVEEHDHASDSEETKTCGEPTASGASTTRAFGLVSLLAALFAFAH